MSVSEMNVGPSIVSIKVVLKLFDIQTGQTLASDNGESPGVNGLMLA